MLLCRVSIVGDDDNGQLFTEREFAEYKQTVADARLHHRLYCSWRNTALALDCRQIGPASQCFCTHRFRQHATDNWESREVHCKVAGCDCRMFDYLPIRGSQEARCHCKHVHDQHNPRTKRCKHSALTSQQKSITSGNDERMSEAAALVSSTSSAALQRRSAASSSGSTSGAKQRPTSSNTALVHRSTRLRPAPSSSSAAGGCQCDRFTSSNSCSCGGLWSQHATVFESKEEREAAGRPVDRYGGTMFQAMGGITGFTSLVDGADKLTLAEERNIRRPQLTADSGGRLVIAEARLEDVGSSERQSARGGTRGPFTSAAESLVAGDDRKERELRRGKMGETDEMALYEQKYKKSMSVRSRTGLRPVTPQRVDDDNTRSGSGTPRRSSFNTSMSANTSATARPASRSSSSSSSAAGISSRPPSSSRASATASPFNSNPSSGSSTPRRAADIPRKPSVPIQRSARRSGSTRSSGEQKVDETN